MSVCVHVCNFVSAGLGVGVGVGVGVVARVRVCDDIQRDESKMHRQIEFEIVIGSYIKNSCEHRWVWIFG